MSRRPEDIHAAKLRGQMPPAPQLHVRHDGMAARIARHDWSSTPLGACEQWPPHLRATVDLMLAHGFPMIVLWGEQLVQLYNDGYAEILADKHPRRPPLAKPKQSRARSRRPSRLSSQVASIASSSARVMAVFLVDRSPRLTAARRARLSRVRTLGNSQGLARRLSLWAVDSTATRWTTVDSFRSSPL